MNRHLCKELAELRTSPQHTLRNMRDLALEYFPEDEALLLIEQLYLGWLLENFDRMSPIKQSEMHRFCKWLSILIITDHLLEI